MTDNYDPNEKRDESGKWTTGGRAGRAGKREQRQSAKEEKLIPWMFTDRLTFTGCTS